MTRDDIISMAREAGIPETATEGVFIANSDDLGRFAVLVISSHQPQSSMSWQEGYEIGVTTEREACAKVCENGTFLHDFAPEAVYSRSCARAIRARGQV